MASSTLILDLNGCGIPNLAWLRRTVSCQPRDHVTLGMIERRLQGEAPGRYWVSRWEPGLTDHRGPSMLVVLEFADPDEMVLWNLRWA